MFEGITWRTNKSPSTFNRNLSAFEKTLLPKLQATAHALAAIGESLAKKNAPVDTGTLRASIKGSVEKMMAAVKLRIEVGVKYGAYPEFGTIYQEAQPYLRPALQKLAPIVVERTVKAYNEALKSTF